MINIQVPINNIHIQLSTIKKPIQLHVSAPIKNIFWAVYIACEVKCTLVQAVRLCTGRTAHRGCRDIALLFLDHGTRRGWGVSITPRPLFTPRKSRYPLYKGLIGPQVRSEQVRKISLPPGFDPRTVQSCGQSLYRLRYPAQMYTLYVYMYTLCIKKSGWTVRVIYSKILYTVWTFDLCVWKYTTHMIFTFCLCTIVYGMNVA